MVDNNMPVSFVKDGQKSPDFIHSQKRNPYTNLRSKTVMRDLRRPLLESLHQVFLMSDLGTIHGIRHMYGYSSRISSLINKGQCAHLSEISFPYPAGHQKLHRC